MRINIRNPLRCEFAITALVIAAIIGATATVIGSAISSSISAGASASNQESQEAATAEQNALDRASSEKIAEENRLSAEKIEQAKLDQELYLAKNEKQLEVADLKSAGLNPAIAGGYGTSSSSSVAAGSGYSNNPSPSSRIGTAANAQESAEELVLGALCESGLKNMSDTKKAIYNQTRANARQAEKACYLAKDSLSQEHSSARF